MAVNTGSPTPPIDAARLIRDPGGVFCKNFNLRSFDFRHDLAGHPLFELPALAALARAILERGDLEKFVALSGKVTAVGTNFSSMAPAERLAEAITGLKEGRSWLKITSANEADPRYAELLRRILLEIESLAATSMMGDVSWSSLTIFLASPGIVTPFHIDHESNFLLQIRGEKDITLFDPNDRLVLRESEIENFYVGNLDSAQYREEIQARGTVYRLMPGRGVHHPPLAPHWVKNGDDVSVSVSVGFGLKPLDRRAKVYQFNRYLRWFGLSPTPPGASALRDWLKAGSLQLLSKPHPSSREELLFSGIERAAAPFKSARNLVRALRGS
jgi:hypothetical protein